jgi:Flp pilus assembly protein TadD
VRFRAHDSEVVFGTKDGIELVECETGRLFGETMTAGYGVSFDIHRNMPLVLSANDLGQIQLWDIETRQTLGAPMSRVGEVRWVGLNQNANRAIAAYKDGTVMVWDCGPALLPSGAGGVRPRWLEILSGLNVLGGGKNRSLLPIDRAERWQKMPSKFKEQLQADCESRILETHRYLARCAESESDWFGTNFHASRLSRLEPRNTKALLACGRSAAELRRWKDAATAFAQLSPLEPQTSDHFIAAALCKLAEGDGKAFAERWLQMQSKFGDSNDPSTIDDVVWLSGWSQSATDAWGRAVALARKNVARKPDNWSYYESLGAVLFRSGQYDEALRTLRQIGKLRKDAKPTVWTRMFIAMSLYKQGRATEARREFQEGQSDIQKALAPSPDAPSGLDWRTRLQYRLLASEAGSLLGISAKDSASAEDGSR